MGCGTSTIKFSMFVLNILCCIFGALIFSACVFALIEFDFCTAIKVPCILGSILSFCLFLNSFLGCFGAIRQSVRLTWIYSVIMLVLMAGQIAVIFLQPVNFNNIATELIEKVWNVTEIENDYLMTSYEIKYQCCGKFGPNDYILLHTTIPASCYYQYNPMNETILYHDGCITKLTEMYALNQQIEEISDWSLVGLEGVTAIMAGMLAINLKNIQRRKYYH